MSEGKPKAYGSHVPVLAACAAIMPIREAIEIGCGRYSTQAFCNKKLFPDLARLISFESKHQWITEVLCIIDKDPRVSFVLGEDVQTLAAVPRMPDVDLALIDGSDEKLRPEFVIALRDKARVIVAHDTEEGYGDVFRKFKYRKSFCVPFPETTVVSDIVPVRQIRIPRVDSDLWISRPRSAHRSA
jgi:hypothetical protein